MAVVISDLLNRCTFPEGPLECAVSGGADSVALLVLATHISKEVKAIHVDHGIRENSGEEANLVFQTAQTLGAEFESLTISIENGPNLEARARKARYSVLPKNVLTGHTADDQAETILLALIRGSAWHGLSGIRPSPQRPILNLRRSETEAVCREFKINFFEDPSNESLIYRRNQIRHQVLPLLNSISDRDLVPLLARQAEILRKGADFLNIESRKIDPTKCDELIKAHIAIARESIRNWVWETRKDDHPPDLATIDRILAVASLEVLSTDIGSGWRVERTNRILRLVPPKKT
ncbi:MAG: tRNA lysidine(34) synthetase TilS [Acidimicrobiaceae bacterium]|jgi:tRNA(Ile)-lysidine synthase|nr:tRNA lysidine(34) synthetase TilS [Acidimicrobiaceae bacterium]|tara:strand:- start:51241 stop:52119 length:879 start_codon:yes stop_codon:yes gene_type:complete